MSEETKFKTTEQEIEYQRAFNLLRIRMRDLSLNLDGSTPDLFYGNLPDIVHIKRYAKEIYDICNRLCPDQDGDCANPIHKQMEKELTELIRKGHELIDD